MPYLTLSDASLAYGHVPLLDHASFQLDPGERVALIGRNGSGKSSLLRALAGQGALDDGVVSTSLVRQIGGSRGCIWGMCRRNPCLRRI